MINLPTPDNGYQIIEIPLRLTRKTTESLSQNIPIETLFTPAHDFIPDTHRVFLDKSNLENILGGYITIHITVQQLEQRA